MEDSIYEYLVLPLDDEDTRLGATWRLHGICIKGQYRIYRRQRTLFPKDQMQKETSGAERSTKSLPEARALLTAFAATPPLVAIDMQRCVFCGGYGWRGIDDKYQPILHADDCLIVLALEWLRDSLVRLSDTQAAS